MTRPSDLIGLFAKHRVAANLLMVMMIMAGILGLSKLNVQFFPNFALDTISVTTIWSGASAEDIESGITIPLEQRLRSIDQLKEMTSSSAPGVSGMTLEFHEGTDMIFALDNVKKQVDDFTNLPEDAEPPRVSRILRYEPVARLLIRGPKRLDELRILARRFEEELLARGIDKIDLLGLPEESIAIEVAAEQLQRLGVGFNELARRIENTSQDLPAGLIGENDGTREIRSQNQRRSPAEFEDINIVSDITARLELGDIANIERRIKPGAAYITIDDHAAVVLVLRRNENGDSLEASTLR